LPRALVVSAISHLGLIAIYLLTAALLLKSAASLGWPGVTVALISYLAISALVLIGLLRLEHHLCFGGANALTLMRAATATLFLGIVVDALLAKDTLAFNTELQWILAALATAALLVDGLDGWVARRKGMASEFGAHFDMETDALSMAALSLLVYTEREVGAWVLLGGVMRYLFVTAGFVWPPLRAPLLPSARRKTICVVQMAALITALAPAVPTRVVQGICLSSLVLLIYSFGADCTWLQRTHLTRQRPRT